METTEESPQLPTASDQITEKADSTSVCPQEAPQESAASEEETKETPDETTASEPVSEEKPCESSEPAVEVSSTDKVITAHQETGAVVEDVAEQKGVELPVISSSEEVANEATTSEDKVVVENRDETSVAPTESAEAEKAVEADTPNVQESDSASEVPPVDEQTPMEVDEKIEEPETAQEAAETTATQPESSSS